jgi:hypothetical protein
MVAACAGDERGGDASAGAEAVEATNQLLDVNDVSWLFAMGPSGAYPDVALGGDGAGPALLSEADFASILKTAQAGRAAAPTLDGRQVDGPAADLRLVRGGDSYGAWRVVGVRFDTCAPGPALPDGSRPCLVQTRLIAQPVSNGGGQDMALHLVYTLGARDEVPGLPRVGPERLAQVAGELGAIRAASAALPGGQTAGAPLGVHPGLLAERALGGEAKVAGLMAAFVRARVGEAIARNEALVGVRGNKQNAPDFWVFAAGQVQDGAAPGERVFRLAPVPTFTRATEFVEGFNILTKNFVPRAPDQPVSTAKYMSSLTGSGDLTDFRNAYDIDDPQKFNFFSQECVSCHTATRQVMVLRRIHGDGQNLASLRGPAKGVTSFVACKNLPGTGTDDCKRTTSPTPTRLETQWNFRNFGYFHNKPVVSMRTAHESEEVALDLNERAFGLREGPGPDCTGAPAGAVFKCMADLPGDKDPKAECLAKLCAPQP